MHGSDRHIKGRESTSKDLGDTVSRSLHFNKSQSPSEEWISLIITLQRTLVPRLLLLSSPYPSNTPLLRPTSIRPSLTVCIKRKRKFGLLHTTSFLEPLPPTTPLTSRRRITNKTTWSPTNRFRWPVLVIKAPISLQPVQRVGKVIKTCSVGSFASFRDPYTTPNRKGWVDVEFRGPATRLWRVWDLVTEVETGPKSYVVRWETHRTPVEAPQWGYH